MVNKQGYITSGVTKGYQYWYPFFIFFTIYNWFKLPKNTKEYQELGDFGGYFLK
jgi:hypothetical protein